MRRQAGTVLSGLPAICGLVLLALVGSLMTQGCGAEEAPIGPPRCEPEGELAVERLLKEGYRAAASGAKDVATKRFEAVLELAAGHPEAIAGLRSIQQAPGAAAPEAVAKPEPGTAGRSVYLAGQAISVDVEVDTQRFRFEERAARRAAQARMKLPLSKAETWYRDRQLSGGARLSPTDRAALVAAIDLVVIHDTHTATVREAFVAADDSGRSTHFMIDYDGTIYQTLDIGHEAAHASDSIDGKAVSVHLANPVSLDVAPLPEGMEGAMERPQSPPRKRHGQLLNTWGYTEAQQESLRHLLRELVRILPNVPREIPRDAAGSVPDVEIRSLGLPHTGVIGHYHLWRTRYDPAPGLDWEGVAAAIKP